MVARNRSGRRPAPQSAAAVAAAYTRVEEAHRRVRDALRGDGEDPDGALADAIVAIYTRVAERQMRVRAALRADGEAPDDDDHIDWVYELVAERQVGVLAAVLTVAPAGPPEGATFDAIREEVVGAWVVGTPPDGARVAADLGELVAMGVIEAAEVMCDGAPATRYRATAGVAAEAAGEA
jgi:hypothetical protein